MNMNNNVAKSGGRRDSGFQPLPPPPEPPSKLYEDDDFDLYADIEAPNPSKLAPPPEPPAMLFALDDDDKDEEAGGGGSDEDAGLVIDDRHDAYDPEMPTSPPSPTPSERDAEEEKRQKKKKRKSAIPAPIYPALEDIPPPPSPPPSGCPNQGLYSKMSQEIAKGKRDDSDNSDNDDDLHLSFPRPPTPPFGTLDLSMKSDKFGHTLDKAREQTVPEDLSAQKNAAKEEDEDIDGVPLEDIALPEDEPGTKIDTKANDDANVDANANNSTDDGEPAAELASESAIVPCEPKSPGELSDVVKSKDLSDGELEDDENEQDEVIRHKESDDETPKKSPKPDAVPLKSTEVRKSDADKVQELLDVLNGTDEPEKPVENGKSVSAVSKGSSDERDDLLELEERDGLVDITDEEISNYEKSWEMEENGKKAGLDGLETEAISDNEYPPGESDAAEEHQTSPPEKPKNKQDAPKRPKGPVENGRSGEEGEIMTNERHPVQWKKLSKTTKERSYRGDKEMSRKEANKEITKKKEKRKELERYDVRKLISEKPRRKVDEFGRDISSHSRSPSRSPSRGRRSVSRGKKRRSRSPSRSKERVRSKERNKERSKSRSRSKEKRREKSIERSKERRSTSRTKKKRRSRSPKKDRSRSPKKDRARSREKTTREGKKRKKSPSMSCSSCSCSSCEREKRRSKKLTVIVTNEEVGKRKEKKKKDKKSSPKNRRRSSPVPSKEVFTSGDNILVSVNFKSSKSGESRKESSKRRKDDENKKKKDKGTKENQPARTIVAAKKSKKKLNTKNMKPVAIIDLDASPFREVVSPKEVIILTDSDSEDKRPQQENPVPVSITGPKTPPEPLIKFNIVNNKQQSLRTMANPLMDALMEQLEDEGDDVEGNEIPHKGPNTPPEPPVPYDPFEPTKSRSPTPVEAQMDRSSPAEAQQTEQIPQTPPKLPQHVAPKTPSPLHSPPKPADEPADKPKLHPFQPAGDSGNDSPGGGGGGGGGDSPYSPGSSEGDELFEPPMPQPGTATKTKSRIPPLPANIKQHLPLPKVTSKKRSKSHKDKKSSSKKEIGIKLDEDQLKILDELPNSAVEMQVKDKFLKKLNRQERVVEEVKMVLKPHYAKKHVTKEEYKEILRKAVPKICHSRTGEINPAKIQRLIEAYVKKYRHKSKKRGSAIPPLRQNKAQVKTLWC